MITLNTTQKLLPQKAFLGNKPQPQKKQEEKDIFTTMPFRLLGYTNEVGEAIKDVVPSARLLSWICASMYMGADIYDKYQKGDEESNYKPSVKKGVCEAVFQGLASCGLTIAAVNIGKGIVSNVGKKVGSSGLSLDSEKELLGFVGKQVRNGALNKENGVQEAILDPIKKMMTETKGMKAPLKFLNPQKSKNYEQICTIAGENMKHTVKMDSEKVERFVNSTLNEVKHLEKGLQTGTLAKDAPTSLNKNFGKTKQAYFDTINHYHHESNPKAKAINETIQNHLQKKAFKHTIIIAIGGLAALLLCSQIIDKGVEKLVIEPLEHKWTQHERRKKKESNPG